MNVRASAAIAGRLRPAKGSGRGASRARTEVELFFEEVEVLRKRWDVLRHPFADRWRAGELSHADLRAYASEYHHAVEAIATASRHAAEAVDGSLGAALVEQAIAEREHVDLWVRFARAVGWQSWAWAYAEEPLPETQECKRVWAGDADRDLANHLVTLYAIESAEPRISEEKVKALATHYGLVDRASTAYFRVHTRRDRDHPQLVRLALIGFLDDAVTVDLLDQVEAVYRANWRLLDGVDALVGS